VSILSIAVVIFSSIYKYDHKLTDLWEDYAYVGLILGLSIWAFSKNKTEDEMTMQQRLEGLQLSVYFNYTMLLLATLLFYSFAYLYALAIASFSILLFFVIRMEYVNYKNNRLLKNFEGEMNHEK